ncbi:MAG TPA: hypothetical protein VN953_02640 [Gemmatimonadales bacterium]|nr:hypothetical protein [Gemmatimonadales bacterium]
MLRWVFGLIVLSGLSRGSVARAQQSATPLDKGELVRLLAERKQSTSEIAGLVRRGCLTFRPTVRDNADLRRAGADGVVFEAVAACARGTAPPPAARPTLRVVAAPSVTAEAGTNVRITVRLLSGRVPRAGTVLVLEGSGRIPGGLTRDARAITDARGRATFRVLAGTVVGTYPLAVRRPDATPALPGGKVVLVTQPAQVLRAAIEPREVTLRWGAHGGGWITVIVADGYGNPVPGVAFELRPVSAELTGPVALPPADAQGRTGVSLTPAQVRREGEVAVFARGASVGSFKVRLVPVVLSRYLTRFTAGTNQRGAAGSPLPDPLVLALRDTSGAPVPDQSVAFTAEGGAVEPVVVSSDSSGTVRVRVVLGRRAGPMVVTATVGGITQTATVSVDPGPPSELVVLRDSVVVKGRLGLESRDPVALRVLARDAYGNETPLTGFAAAATGRALRIKGVSIGAGQAVVTLEPRRTGTGELELRGSGLGTKVAVGVTLPGLAGQWVFGGRGGVSGFIYDFSQRAYIQGRTGFRGEVFAGRAVTPRLRIELGAARGALNADSGLVEMSVALTQGFARAEYGLLPAATVRPIVSLGGGLFRLVSDDPRHQVDHSSLMWLMGAGVDFTLGPSVLAEVRLEHHQLNEVTSSIANGHVGSLTMVSAGVRLTP